MNPLHLPVEILVSTLAFAVMTFAILQGKKGIFRNVRKGRAVFRGTASLTGGLMLINGIFLLLSIGPAEVLPPTSTVHIIVHYLGIVILAGTGIILLHSKIVTERTPTPRRVLAIGAHPDDLEIACGATLSKLHDAGHIIYGLVLTEGERGGNHNIRSKEALRGGNFMGLDIIDVRNFTDTKLSREENAISRTIEEIIGRFKPDIVFTHSVNDQHQDHTAVYAATLRAARNQSTILCYESPSVTRSFNPTIFVDISNHLDVKLESIRQHHDQRSKPYVQRERVRGTATFRGSQAKTRYAEGFEAVRLLSSAVADF